jgi:hypothetical protein
MAVNIDGWGACMKELDIADVDRAMLVFLDTKFSAHTVGILRVRNRSTRVPTVSSQFGSISIPFEDRGKDKTFHDSVCGESQFGDQG